MLGQRLALSVEGWRMKSDRISQILSQDPAFRSAQTVLAYFSTRREPDLSPLFAQNLGQVFGFPLCEGNNLLWRQWHPGDPLVAGRFGIQEPRRSAMPLFPGQVDLLLVPCVGCDHGGYRLGYGGGFYDRLLAKPEWRLIPTIGIAFDFAVIEAIPVDPYDQPLDRICTNHGFLFPKIN